MGKETLNEAIMNIEGFSAVGDEEKAALQEEVLKFGDYLASAAKIIPIKDRGGEIDTRGRFFQSLHWLLALSERGISREILEKLIDLAGRKVGAEYNPAYEIEETPEGLTFKRRG